MKQLLSVVGLALVMMGCSGNPNSPSNFAQVSGTWSGTLESTNYQAVGIFVTLSQSAGTVSGTWSGLNGTNALAGNISGTTDTTSFTGTITLSINQSASCSGSFSGSAKDASLTWTSAGFTGNCNLVAGNPVSPRFVLQRR